MEVQTETALRDLEQISDWPYPIPFEDQLLWVVLDGDPIPLARARLAKSGHFYTPKSSAQYAKELRLALRGAFRPLDPSGALDPDNPPKYFGVRAFFYRKTRHKVDVDNLLKAVLDSGTIHGTGGQAGRNLDGFGMWEDDSLVVEVFGRRFYDPKRPRLVLLVYTVPSAGLDRAAHSYECTRCGNPIAVQTPHEIGNVLYCSAECRHPRVTIECVVCGTPRTMFQSDYDYRIGRGHPSNCCSRRCACVLASRAKQGDLPPAAPEP